MRKIVFFTMALAVLTGFAIADPGINQTPETQGIVTATTINAIGNFASTSDLAWRTTNDGDGLTGALELNEIVDWNSPHSDRSLAYYASSYSEDTISNGVGLIAYDKNLDVDTSEQLPGQWNIDADKQIEFVGVDGARVYSDENIMVDGVGNWSMAGDQMICPFAGSSAPWTIILPTGTYHTLGYSIFPASCNYAEAGSTIDMSVANVRTSSNDRFITPSADTSVELEHDILVTELADGVPSVGSASTHMNAVIRESRGIYLTTSIETDEIRSNLMEQIEFSEVTSVTGDISTFAKEMSYNSLYTGSGGMTFQEIVY